MQTIDGERELRLALGSDVEIGATMTLPPSAQSLVLFAHGSGSSRHSSRNRAVAQTLNEAGIATLLIDLLTIGEEAVDQHTRQFRFDIGRLAQRLSLTLNWLETQPETRDLKLGLFGASTGAGAALVAAAERHDAVSAVVSRGGRPDLAGASLNYVVAPTLLIVGGADATVLELNTLALQHLGGPKQLEVIPGATHLFEEPGMLEQVEQLARAWFEKYLV
jgi:alpha-beta hydrolase superfamily lysophospholipase